MVFGYIYEIVNLINFKKYIGQTINPRSRKIAHFAELRNLTHDNIYLQNAFNQYGEDNFDYFIIDTADSAEELDDLENYHMKMAGFPDRALCYNMQTAEGVKRESLGIYEKADEICEKYKQGIPVTKLVEMYNSSLTVIYGILEMNDVELRGCIRYDLRDALPEIINYYSKGIGSSSIAQKFGTNPHQILKLLNKEGIITRSIQDAHKLKRHNSWKFSDEICKYYQEGYNLTHLALMYDSSPYVISSILEDNGIMKRPSKRDDLSYENICKDYVEGMSSRQLAKKYNCSKTTILNILKRSNISRRDSTKTQFKKGHKPANYGKSLIDKNGGIDFLKQQILLGKSMKQISI